MNYQHIAAIRQLNERRDFQASMLLSGGAPAAPINDRIAQIDDALTQRMQSQFRDEEVMLDKLLRGGDDAISAQERMAIQNTMSTTTGLEGGFSVPTTIGLAVADALKQFSCVRRIATVIVTETGANMSWPSSDGRSEVGEQLSQNASSSSLDPAFGTTAVNTFKYGSKIITVPFELAQDSAIDFTAFITGRIASRIGRITNTKLTIGTGAGEPLGLVPAVTVGKTGATGQTASLTYDDLEDLVTSVDPAYRESEKCAWMMADSTLNFIRKLKDTAGRPLNLVVPGIRALGQPDTIHGYPVITNPDMAAMAANARSILFGDFSVYIVRDVPATAIYRFTDSVYSTRGQIGFLGMARVGGAYTDTGTAIRCYQNSAT